MKNTFILIAILLLIGMPVFAQQGPDMSLYSEEFNKSDTTLNDMRDILTAVRDMQLTGIGEFYHNSLIRFIQRLPNYTGTQERLVIEEASRLLLRGLAAEKYHDSAPQVWFLIRFFDISQPPNDGLLMYEALVAMGQIGGKEYAQHMIDILEGYNARPPINDESKAKVERVVPGIVNALETLSEPRGVRPVFFASIGWYDTRVKQIASDAVINMMEAEGEVIGDIISNIILDHFNFPPVKLAAWQTLLQADVSDAVKSKAATAVVEASYSFHTNTREHQNILYAMRLNAIDVIRVSGVEDDHIYAFLERAYREAYDTPNTDVDMIRTVVFCLAGVNTEESIALLSEVLRELHSRKRSGPWTLVDRDIMAFVISAAGSTGTKSPTIIQLLTVISISSVYTSAEQGWARNALMALRR